MLSYAAITGGRSSDAWTLSFTTKTTASDSYLDLDRAPYVLYGVKYIDLVSLAPLFRG